MSTKPTPPIKIAYAEDHTLVRECIVSYISGPDIEFVIQASNGLELINLMEVATTKPDICIVDIRMPQLNGFQAIEIIKKKWSGTKFLVLTTFTEEMYVLRMISAGVHGYLPKYCGPTELKKAIMAIHLQGIYYSDLFAEKIAISLHHNKTKIPNFTEKEQQFLKHCCSDMTYVQIADLMHSTPKSIEGYRDSLFKKVQVNSRVGLALFAVRTGIVPLECGPLDF